jgi:hypothetical protein
MENKRKHLEFIQSVITRMAGNLFFLRGWTITLVTGLFALSATKGTSDTYIILAYFLLAIFWILDGYFLSQERRFRCLYDDVRKLEEKDIDFSMKTSNYAGEWQNQWWGSMLSSTLLCFYVPLALAMLIVLFLINK